MLIALSAFSATTVPSAYTLPKLQPKGVVEICVELEPIKVEIKQENLQEFLTDMAQRESSGRSKVVNKWGYMGLYQIGRTAMKDTGYGRVTNREFLSNPELQTEIMVVLMKKNKKRLRRQIKKYNGTMVHGVYVTESGLIAAAHLGGAGGVKKWLRSGKNPKDGLGTPITEYIKLFNNYNLNI